MCKFNSPKDANFTRLANALSGAVEDLLTNGITYGPRRYEQLD
jgi:hypothetical protein